VLCQYPLTRRYAAEVAALTGGRPEFLTLAGLRELPVVGMVARLRSVSRGPMAIALEDPTSAGALPILKLIASVSRAAELMVVDPELRPSRFGRLGQVAEGVRFAGACLDGQLAIRRSMGLLQALAKAPRLEARLKPGVKHAAYLNTNLWFGAKAGGSMGHISGVANGLMGHGYSLDYMAVGGRLLIRPEARHLELEPPEVFGLPFEANHYRFDHGFEAQALRHIDPERTSFLYQRLSIGNFTGVRLSRALRLPLVMEYNGSEVWVANNWGTGLRYSAPAEAAEAQSLRHAHLIVTISDVLRDELLQRGVEPQRIVTYPNCIEPETFDPARFPPEAVAELRRREQIPEDACLATFVGTFGAWHGAEVFAEAIRELCANHSDVLRMTKLRFLFVGDGLRMPIVRSILDNAACEPFVHFAGLVLQAQAPAYLAASDILVSPHVPNADGTRFIGSPTKLFEYMGMGKAILASDLDQVGDVLRNSIGIEDAGVDPETVARQRRLAVLLPPGDFRALADGLVMLARRPELRGALGANARAEALSTYTWERHVAAILDRLLAVAGA
jgi:glycosyltransferase involved in cell wall biosynthesis